LWVKYNNWRPVIEISDTGKIDTVGPMDIEGDRYRAIELGDLIEEKINQVKFYFLKCDEDVEKFQKYLYDYASTKVEGGLMSILNGIRSETSISAGHEHINFIHTFGGLKEFQTHIEDFRKNDKVIYITINSIAEAEQRWINNSKKNLLDNEFCSLLDDETEQQNHLEEHIKIYNIVNTEKRKKDIILPMKYIYKKEYLRNFLRNEFEWNDRCYDVLYDAWYDKQTKSKKIMDEQEGDKT